MLHFRFVDPAQVQALIEKTLTELKGSQAGDVSFQNKFSVLRAIMLSHDEL